AGQHISLRLYDKSKNQEYELSVEFVNPYGDAHTSLYAPEGDGAYSIAKISKSSAGIVHAEGMKLYPNPANKVVHLMAPTSMQQVSIYNYSGKLIRKVVPAKSNIDVDISTLESGIYLFRIYTETEQINRKVIVE
ncbi:MAG: T9SS type A sorting domain-containing protein, partial [Bacteroidales bacterium]|nr:T9SS type A sorting domain-containing protein [Bacteroidales bacterium]